MLGLGVCSAPGPVGVERTAAVLSSIGLMCVLTVCALECAPVPTLDDGTTHHTHGRLMRAAGMCTQLNCWSLLVPPGVGPPGRGNLTSERARV